jgi:HK97 family phage prohead protease
VTFIRSAEFELRDDGRTLFGRVVPYGEVASIVEVDESTKDLVRYREQFLPHSFAAMAQGFKARGGDRSQRSNMFVALLMNHSDRLDDMIGHAIELDDRDDGAYATFRLYDDDRITRIRSILTESHTGLSVSFAELKPARIIDGIVSRVQVAINHVAATPTPAYSGARIESMRSTEEMCVETPRLNNVREWLQEQRKLPVRESHEQ